MLTGNSVSGNIPHMNDTEFMKYVALLMSMSLDYKMGKLTRGTYQSNLRRFANQMAPQSCTCGKCMGTDVEACYKENENESR